MKKRSLIGILIILIVIWILRFLARNQIENNEDFHELSTSGEIILEPENITGEVVEPLVESQNTTQPGNPIEEKTENKDESEPQQEPNHNEDYPKYWVIENDYWDESKPIEEDINHEETEKLLMDALNQRDKEMVNEGITNETNETNETISNMTVIINWKKYIAELENNETAQLFYNDIIADNSAEFNMEELNWNEKYVYLQETLPSNPKVPEKIESWDIMLYWNNCIVIFYKSFTTTYSYTKIGHIKNMQDLWTESVTVQFS